MSAHRLSDKTEALQGGKSAGPMSWIKPVTRVFSSGKNTWFKDSKLSESESSSDSLDKPRQGSRSSDSFEQLFGKEENEDDMVPSIEDFTDAFNEILGSSKRSPAKTSEPSSPISPGTSRRRYTIGEQYKVVGNLYFSVHKDAKYTEDAIENNRVSFFWSTGLHDMGYMSFCDDFGPNKISHVIAFASTVKKWVSNPLLCSGNRPVVYYSYDNKRHVTNAVFLLAAYLMLELDYNPEMAWAPFASISSSLATYRDASHVPQNFDLSVLDCLQGLHQALKRAWINYKTFDLVAFETWGNPKCANITKLGDKFIAFPGPTCDLTLSFYAKAFQIFGVQAVVRLNEKEYDAAEFTAAGMKHFDLYFEDCSTPSDDIVEKFLDLCDENDGVIAVHCLAGLGRTGTLIALFIMKNYGFTPKEAIGFLRLMRPGCVIGPQQHYLQECAQRGWHDNSNRLRPLAEENPLAHQSKEACKSMASHLLRVLKTKSKNQKSLMGLGVLPPGTL